MALRNALYLLLLLVAVLALCYFAERDLCLVVTYWVLGCCGCCTDFASDEARFREWQRLEAEEKRAATPPRSPPIAQEAHDDDEEQAIAPAPAAWQA